MTTAIHRALEAFPAVPHTVKPDDRTPTYLKKFRAANQVRASLFDDNLLEKIKALFAALGETLPEGYTPLPTDKFAEFCELQFDAFTRLRTAIDFDHPEAVLHHSYRLIYNTLVALLSMGFDPKQLDLAMQEYHAWCLLSTGTGAFGPETENPVLTPFVPPLATSATFPSVPSE